LATIDWLPQPDLQATLNSVFIADNNPLAAAKVDDKIERQVNMLEDRLLQLNTKTGR
jgi:hypothetical protein